jgi:aspartate kinase
MTRPEVVVPVAATNVPVVVQKYGGSSVADADKLRRVAERVVKTAAQGKRVCVVVSAMGDTTDELLALARQVSKNPPRRELDMLLSTGERISMALLSMAIAELGYEAISFTGSQSGIITNDRHTGARIVEVRPYRIEDELARGKIVIVAGYQGVSYKKEITTLGRGGSDTTAVALAAALSAEHCEICSDVDGVYTADPRVVGAEAVEKLVALTYDEMQELAESGAKVLNPQAVEFARRAGIAIWARQTHGAGDGTRVTADGHADRRIKGVAGDRQVLRLRLAPGESGQPTAARLAELLSALEDRAVAVRRAHAGEGGCSVVVNQENLHDGERVLAQLAERFGTALSVDEDLAEVAMVGEGIGQDTTLSLAALQVAREVGARVTAMDAGPLRIGALVDRAHVDAVVRAWHAHFVVGDAWAQKVAS